MDEHGCCRNFAGCFDWHHSSQLAARPTPTYTTQAATPHQSRTPWPGPSHNVASFTSRRDRGNPQPPARRTAHVSTNDHSMCTRHPHLDKKASAPWRVRIKAFQEGRGATVLQQLTRPPDLSCWAQRAHEVILLPAKRSQRLHSHWAG